MKVLKKLRKKFLNRSDIFLHGSLYMKRWRLLHLKTCGMRIHNIVRDDADRELHDHPFTFLTFILWGGYFEETLDTSKVGIDERGYPFTKKKWYGPGSILLKRAEDLHRLDMGPKGSAWTFSLRGPTWRQWGFLTKDGWIPAYEFDTWRERNGLPPTFQTLGANSHYDTDRARPN